MPKHNKRQPYAEAIGIYMLILLFCGRRAVELSALEVHTAEHVTCNVSAPIH